MYQIETKYIEKDMQWEVCLFLYIFFIFLFVIITKTELYFKYSELSLV